MNVSEGPAYDPDSAMTVQAQIDSAAGDRLARRNALLLAVAQSVGGVTASIVFALGGLGRIRAARLRTACGMLPAGYIMRHLGRRTSYLSAAMLSGLSGLITCFGIIQESFLVLLLGTICSGSAGAFVQSYRFAAADTASDTFRHKAISWVMTCGVLAGIIGQQTVIATKDLFEPIMFAGSFAAIAVLNLIAVCLLILVRIPKPTAAERATKGRPLLQIISQELFIVAAACGIGSYALMSFVMTATFLAMIGCGLTQTDVALAIQWHVLAMYVPSFFTGALIARFGQARIVAFGLLLLVGCGFVALAGVNVEHFWVALGCSGSAGISALSARPQ
ncbi:MFS transporter [Breoghania sp.]|uniref:MFS transporter n=1 Tax=Breoghania sp. TaxID=2065378 RepID=UPI003204BEE5